MNWAVKKPGPKWRRFFCFKPIHESNEPINNKIINISAVKRWTLFKYSANFSSALIRAAFCLRPNPGDIKSKLEQSDN